MTLPNLNEVRPRPKPNRCANCLEPCVTIFCCLECAEERYALIHEALEAMSASVRFHLGLQH